MKLFLTSYAKYSLEKVVPLLPKKPEELTVAFIPTASDAYKYRPWVDGDRAILTRLGFKVFDVGLQAHLDKDGYPIEDKTKNEAELRDELSEADIIFVTGGNTFYLLAQAQKSGFMTILREMVEDGKIYIGSSAGSVLVGPDIVPCEFFDDRAEAGELTDTRGLGFVDFVMQPHYDPINPDPEFLEAEKKYGKEFKLLKVQNSQVVVVEENGFKII